MRVGFISIAGISIAVLVALAMVGRGPEESQAASFTVTTTSDSGAGSLRQAILDANSGGLDVINFDSSVFPASSPATINLIGELPQINGAAGVTIDGSGAGVIIDGQALGNGEVGLSATSGSQSLSEVTLRNLTVRGFPGHGISVCGGDLPACERDIADLELDGVTSSENGGNGLSIRGRTVSGVLLNDCAFPMNGVDGVLVRSALDLNNLHVDGCAVDDNEGDGVFVSSEAGITNFRLVDSSVSGNGTLGTYLDSVEETVDPAIDNVDALNNGQMGIGFSSAQPLSGLTFTNSNVDGNGSLNGNGLGTEILAFQVIDATITGNSFSNNLASNKVGGRGLQVYSQFEKPSGLVITDNAVIGNVGTGITIHTDTPGNQPVDLSTISDNEVSGNTWDGVAIIDSERVTISRNRIFDNSGIGINLFGGEPEESTDGVTPNDPGDGDHGSNELLNFPVLTGASAGSVEGTACFGCKVELFVSDGDPSGHGEGETFVADATAGVSGAFSVPVSDLCAGMLITATVTDAQGNTSEFSLNYPMPVDSGPCVEPVIVTWGDNNCSDSADPIDSLLTLRFDAGLSTNTGECPGMGEVVEVTNASPHPWGDVDCGGDVNPVDSLKLLRFDAGLDVAQAAGCPEVGAEVQVLAQQQQGPQP